MIFGAFWSIAGFISYKSDIQLGIALAGINMLGIGLIMIHLASQNVEITTLKNQGQAQSE